MDSGQQRGSVLATGLLWTKLQGFIVLSYEVLGQWFSTIDVLQTPCGSAPMMEDPVHGEGKRENSPGNSKVFSHSEKTTFIARLDR